VGWVIDAKKWLGQDIGDEFSAAKLGDARRTSRVMEIARAAEDMPDASFPQMVESDGEVEAIYRCLGNDEVNADAVLAPHIAATMCRATQFPLCLMVHDTTAFEFSGEREGLGLMQGNRQGFYAHFAIAVLPGPARVPLGVAGLERLTRKERKGPKRKPHSYYTSQDPTRESLRWGRVLEDIEERRAGFECIHVMDREADIFDLMAQAVRSGARFVIRGDKERSLVNEAGVVKGLLAKTEPRAYREVEVGERVAKRRELIENKPGASRKQRVAKLAVGSHTVEIRRPGTAHAPETSLKLNLVYVWEPTPPRGQAPVDWVLFTTEPIGTKEQLNAIVDHYRSRWVIEEFFKALKTGCSFEKRQLESFHALSNALAVFSAVAWRMLLARAISRAYPNARASTVLSKVELHLLTHRLKLTKPPSTAEEALFAVARLGGHLKRNGDPGWQTLGRGFEKLILLEAGLRAAAEFKGEM
jgi:hypothetical protein